jgi:hypothetical protein
MDAIDMWRTCIKNAYAYISQLKISGKGWGTDLPLPVHKSSKCDHRTMRVMGHKISSIRGRELNNPPGHEAPASVALVL